MVLGKKWIRRSGEEKRHHVQAWKESGLTQKDYCERHHLPLKSFEKWLRIERNGQIKLEPVEVDLTLLTQRSLSATLTFPSGIQCKLEQVDRIEDICSLIRRYEQCS